MLSRIKWESIDDFRPPKGSLKHVPKSEHAALFRARAQKDNNALALLIRKESRSLTCRQLFTRKHGVMVSMPVIPLLHFPKGFASPCPAMIETLPLELRFKIIKLLDINDRVCFALTSRTMAQAIARITKPSDLEYEMEYDLYGLDEHEELMDRLCAWMPSYLRYCYHCVAFVPRLSFGPTHDELDQLVCMDCRFYGHKRLRPFIGSSDECDGCLSLDAAVDNYLDEHPEVGSMYVWDRLSGRLLDEVSLTIDSEEYWTLT